MGRTGSIRAVVSAAAVLALLAAYPAESANLRAIPSLTTEGRWDTNVFNTSINEESDFVFRASPRLVFSIDVFETTINLGGGFDAEKYSSHEELDKSTATKNIYLTTLEPLRITPQFSMKPTLRFVETSDAVRRNALTQSTDLGIPPSETLVTARTEVRETSGFLQMLYLMTPKLDLGIGGGGVKREFTERVPGLSDSSSVSGNASIGYRIFPRWIAGVYFSTANNSYENAPNSQVYSGELTLNYLLTDHLTVDARAGASMYRGNVATGSQKTDQWSPSGGLVLNYNGKDIRAMLSGSYDWAGGGSLGRTTKRSNASLSIAGGFAPRLSWSLAGSWQSNRSSNGLATDELVTADGNAGIYYQAAKWASVYLSGNTFRQWSNGVTVGDIKRHSIVLGLTISDVYSIF